MDRADYIKLSDFVRYASEVIKAERCSVFVYDNKNDELWTTLADGMEQIIIDSGKGIVGEVIKRQERITENNVYSNPNFFKGIDEKSGFKTENIIAVPIFNSKNDEVIGVLELMNKEGGFTEEDESHMDFFAKFISVFIKNGTRK